MSLNKADAAPNESNMVGLTIRWSACAAARAVTLGLIAVLALAAGCGSAVAQRNEPSSPRSIPPPTASKAAADLLLRAYPEHLLAIEGNEIIWRDGTRMPFDDGRGEKPYEEWLASPDLKDMLKVPYRPGPVTRPPGRHIDPGRARNTAFFDKIYGDCSKGEVGKNLVDIIWLPHKYGRRLKITRINGVAERLAAISADLDRLPARFDRYLLPPAGTYACRVIAGTTRRSAHGYGIAIDIATTDADYWRWLRVRSDRSPPPWRNRIPQEIVDVFERNGFIWGGKWSHFDTMHFEYRPELLPQAR